MQSYQAAQLGAPLKNYAVKCNHMLTLNNIVTAPEMQHAQKHTQAKPFANTQHRAMCLEEMRAEVRLQPSSQLRSLQSTKLQSNQEPISKHTTACNRSRRPT